MAKNTSLFHSMSLSNVVCLTITANVLGIKEGGMVNGAMSRKVEITLNSAVSLVQTLQPLLFIPCYKSGCGELRGVTRRSRNAFELQLAYNVHGLAKLPTFENKTSYQNLIRQFCQTAVTCWAVYQ